MAEISISGIVLRRKNSGESDRRLTLLTLELGKIDVTAKGARKAASRLAGVSEPLCAAVFGIASGKVNRFITQAQPMSSFRGLRTDFGRLSFALALLELYALILPLEDPNPEAFELLTVSLNQIESHPKPMVAYVWAEALLLNISGFQPQFSRCAICDRPADLPQGAVSPSSGGFLCPDHSSSGSNCFLASREVLIGLTKISELDRPPDNLKFAEECLNALLPFWRYIAEAPLPANDALQKYIYSERMDAPVF